MGVSDYQTLMLPVLEAASRGEVRIGEVADGLAEQLSVSPEDRAALLPSGRQTILNNRVHWAKTYLMKAGLVESTKRGHFRITPRGKKVLASPPVRIDNLFLNQFEEFRQFKDRSAQSAAEEAGIEPAVTPALVNRTETPDEIMRVAHRQIETSLAQDLLDRILAAAADFFERLIVNLLLSMGFGGPSRMQGAHSAVAATTASMA